ncbi:MAG: hypothetical protein P8047_14325 [Gammaproteobacteria bacterium]
MNKLYAFCAVTLFLYSGFSYADNRLKASLIKLEKCQKSLKSDCLAAYTFPSLVEATGGLDKLIKTMRNYYKNMDKKEIHPDYHNFVIGKPLKTFDYKNYIVTLVPTKTKLIMKDHMGSVESTLIGYSIKGSSRWYFINGKQENIKFIMKDIPGVISEINIPPPKMTLDGKSYKKVNGAWEKL